MKIGDRVRVRLSPHLRHDDARLWGYIGAWWHTGTVIKVEPSDPWPVQVWMDDDYRFPFMINLFRRDELEVL